MENNFINVHNFDGQLKNRYSKKRIYSNEENLLNGNHPRGNI